MKALVTGATGFIGKALCEQLDAPHVLSRNPEKAKQKLGDVTAFAWADPVNEPPPAEAFEGVDTVFHLAGENIAEGAWTDAKKKRIHDSRAEATARLVEAMIELENKPKTFVSTSAIGYYGSRGDELLTEESTQGEDFLAQVCGDWEAAAKKAARKKIRVVNPRIGVVLGNGGGALSKMLIPFKLCLGGRLGGGQQWMSWIHHDDVVGLLLWGAQTEDLEGPYNVVAPDPLINIDFTKALGRAVGRPTPFPAPAVAMRFALGEMADALLLSSTRVKPAVALEKGYTFKYPGIDAALANLVRGEKPAEEPKAA